jgi:hypothetical protein
MPVISSCPRCQRQVSIPAGVDSAAVVRCPLCDAEYALSEALVLAPPELIPVAAAAASEIEVDLPLEVNEAAAVAQRMPIAVGSRLRRRQTSWLGRTVGLVVGGLAGCVFALYILAIFLGPEYHKRGFPERIHIGDLVDVPMPLMTWLTTPAVKKEKATQNPAVEKSAHPDGAKQKPPADESPSTEKPETPAAETTPPL